MVAHPASLSHADGTRPIVRGAARSKRKLLQRFEIVPDNPCLADNRSAKLDLSPVGHSTTKLYIEPMRRFVAIKNPEVSPDASIGSLSFGQILHQSHAKSLTPEVRPDVKVVNM